MRDFPSLKVLDRFQPLFRRFGVDYEVMRKILQVKFIMDRRRVPTVLSQSNNETKKEMKEKNHFLSSLWVYVLFGLFLIPFIIMGDNFLFQMSLVYGLIMFFLMTAMISDFSTVLLDIRDNNILYPKPIERKTISAAKFVHIVIYLSLLTAALAGPGLIVGLLRHGIVFFLVGLLNLILIELLVIALTALIYMLILKFFDGEKLKDIINYVQIGLTLTIMIGYQILIRSFEIVDLFVQLEPAWWQIFVFPIWYGVMTELAINGGANSFFFLLAGLGIIVPLLAIWSYVKLTPTFERNLQKLAHHGKARKEKRSKIRDSLLKFISPASEERAFYRFAGIMFRNEREFKLRVYPSLGFSVLFPIIFLFTNMDGYSWEAILDAGKGKAYLNIYFSFIMIPGIISSLQYSGKYKGAWIYKAAPITSLKPVFSGTMKAFIVNLYLPVYGLLAVIFLALGGVRIIPDLIVIFINAILCSLICFVILEKAVPFSRPIGTYKQGSAITIFMLMFLIGLFVAVHFASTFIPYGVYIYLAVSVLAVMIMWRKIFNVSWDKVQ